VTAPPPPPPGGYPPPPPGGYPPPPGYPIPPRRWILPTNAYTPFSTRVWAFLIDWTPIWLLLIPWVGAGIVTDSNCTSCTPGEAGFWLVAFLISLPAMAIYFSWNFCYRQGKTGQSIGKSALKFKVISDKTWQPIGFWLSLVRQLAHHIDQTICYVGYLFPIWDDQRQTLADKIMSTVCVPLNPPQPPPQPSPDSSVGIF
jgi:uncharacterized RDD family membrane protein YckC